MNLKTHTHSKKFAEICIALAPAICLILLLWLTKEFLRLGIISLAIAQLLVVSYQLYVPIILIRRKNESLYDYGIHFYGLFKNCDKKGMYHEFRNTFLAIAILFLAYFMCYFAYYYLSKPTGAQLIFNATMPSDLFSLVAYNIALVALPEELFYRGYVQTTLHRLYPNKLTLIFLPVGCAILLTNIIFALGHFVGDYDVARLTTFFPGMIFSMLVFYSRSIVGAIIFHAACNIFSVFLSTSLTFEY